MDSPPPFWTTWKLSWNVDKIPKKHIQLVSVPHCDNKLQLNKKNDTLLLKQPSNQPGDELFL